MTLTRIQLNPFHTETYALIGDPYLLHQRLCRCFGASRKEASVLHRIEEGPVLLIQSATEGDWNLIGESSQIFRSSPESKEFDPQFAVGQRLAFRLRCRPSKKVKVEGAKNSRFRGLKSDEERTAWLERQGAQKGFKIESVLITEEQWTDTKPGESEPGRLFPVSRFDGVLIVTDPDKLREAVRNGIGPQKAYGFGLLSLAPCRD